jgi:hypothetical protein
VYLKFRVTRKRLVLLVVAAALVTGGVAYATIPDSAGVYTACRLNNVGTIRLIDPTATPASSLLSHCTSLETPITWNQTGPQGPAGSAGAAGPQGAKGDPGMSVVYTHPSTLPVVELIGPTQLFEGLALPKGRYLISIDVALKNDHRWGDVVQASMGVCSLSEIVPGTVGFQFVSRSGRVTVPAPDFNDPRGSQMGFATAHIGGIAQVNGGSLWITCDFNNDVNHPLSIFGIDQTAIPVTNVISQ